MKIKAIIFDVGGVFFLAKNKRKKENLHTSFKEACFLLKHKPSDFEKFYKKAIKIYLRSSSAKISKQETLKLLSRELGVSPKETEKTFKELYKKNSIENKELYGFIMRLKRKGYKVGISSIQSHLSKDVLILPKYYKNFDALQISCEDGLRKPDEKAFKSILKKLKVNAKEVIFIDDKQDNVAAARKLEMKGILFKDNKQFIKDLRKIGVKI